MGARLVDVSGRLDELADLGRKGVDLWAVLDRVEGEEGMGDRDLVGVSVRLPSEALAEAEALADALAHTPEARAAGGHWGRAAVIRLAVAEGLRVLDKRARKGGA